MLDLFEIMIPTSGRLGYWKLVGLLIRHFYILIINRKFIGPPQKPTLDFLFSAYQQVFDKKFPISYYIFYRLCGRKLIHVCKYQESRVGFALFRMGPIDNIHLCSMGILNSYRGKGLSKPFLYTILQHWKEQGFKTSSLFVEAHNFIAIKTYLALGYQPVREIENMTFMFKKL